MNILLKFLSFVE